MEWFIWEQGLIAGMAAGLVFAFNKRHNLLCQIDCCEIERCVTNV